jgi:diguanylate cyclase (GGDEF)-like protein
VGIEESDIQRWQQSTFSDDLIARLLAQIQKYQPAVIGLDIYRDIPQPPGQTKLRQQLEAENVIAINNINSDGGVPAPPNVPPQRVGFNNFLLDHDGKIRRNLMAFQTNDRALYSFALQVSRNYLDIQDSSIELEPNFFKIERTILPALKPNAGGYQLSASDVAGSQIILNYRSPNKAARQLSFTQVVEGDFNPDWLQGKIVIIGYTAPSKKDIFSTPFDVEKMPGVIIHAHMVSQILSTVLDAQPIFRFLPQWGEVVWFWLWSLAGAILVWRIEHPLTLGAGLIALVGMLSGICFIAFLEAIWIPVTPTFISLLSTIGVILAYKTFYTSAIDESTGLVNRKQIIDLLCHHLSKSNKSSVAVLTVQVSRFEALNDSLGKSIGDRLLILVSKRIKNCIRSQDSLARVGTAEFALALFTLQHQDYGIAIAKRIQQQLALAFDVKGREIIISTNIGIAFYEPGDKTKAEELLRNSNIALERAKVLGSDRYAVFVSRMYSETVAQWQLESDLRHGIEHQEFELYYQPIIDLKTSRVAGFEALVRWISPTRGFVSPGEFIPLAESTGLILPLSDWILREACLQMHHWHQQFNLEPKLTISINVSGYQFRSNLVRQVQQILLETQLAPQCLKLEITESAVVDNVAEAIALLRQLKTIGIELSIDDFGTGYSSLGYLQQFCADTLKVDRSFVRELESSSKNKAIVDIIVTLAHKLDMDVVAEGIETEEQKTILQALNCEYGQGYLFAKPLKSQDATDLLKQQHTVIYINNARSTKSTT